jgi:hypothetical protein
VNPKGTHDRRQHRVGHPFPPAPSNGRQVGTLRLDYVTSVDLVLGQCLLRHVEDADLHQPAREPPRGTAIPPCWGRKSERAGGGGSQSESVKYSVYWEITGITSRREGSQLSQCQ